MAISAVLWWFMGTLAVPLVLAIAVLITPVKLGIAVRTSPRWQLKVAAQLFGGLTPRLSIHDSANQRRKQKRPTAKGKKKKPAVTSRPALAKISRVTAAGPRLMADLLRPIHLERLQVDADVGLADPADTGQLFGMLAAVRCSQLPTSAVSIDVRPDFSGPRASGEVDAVLSFIPVAFIWPGIRLAKLVFGSRS